MLKQLTTLFAHTPPFAVLLIGIAIGIFASIPVGIGIHKYSCEKIISELKQRLHKRISARVKKRIDALYELTYELATTLNYRRVLDMILDVALQTLEEGGEKIVGAVLLFDENDSLGIATSRHLPPSDKKKRFEGKKGALSIAITTQEAVSLFNPSQDPELKTLIALQEAQSAYLLPLVVGLEIYGVVIFAAKAPDFFTDERVEMLGVLSKQAAIALQNARLYETLQREKQRLAESEAEARKKLARDLHDGPTQTIAAIAMRASYVLRLIDKDPQTAKEEIAQIEQLARQTAKEIRHLLFTLRPLILETQGLPAALQTMAAKMKEVYGQNVLVEVDPRAIELMDLNRQTIAFYVAEEAVNNARKHAKASHIWVRMRLVREDIALLEVQDDGKGFDVSEVGSNYEQRGSFGMVNMRERAAMVSGHLEIHSEPENGTIIRLWIPLTEDAAQRLQAGKLG